MLSPAEIVEELVQLGEDDEGAFAYFASDAQVMPVEDDIVLRGHAEMRTYRAQTATRTRPALRGCTVHECGASAVVLATMAFTRDSPGAGRPFVEIRPVGFVLDVADGKVTRTTRYDTWQEARAAAGLPVASVGRRLAEPFFSVARRVMRARRSGPELAAPRPAATAAG